MALIGIRLNTKRAELRRLHAADVQLHAMLLEIIHALAVRVERRGYISPIYGGRSYSYTVAPSIDFDADEKAASGAGTAIDDNRLYISAVRYTNPFDIVGFLKAVPKAAIDAVLERTLFYRDEKRKRELENKAREQEVRQLRQAVRRASQEVALAKQEVAVRRLEAELRKQEVIQLKLTNVKTAQSLVNVLQEEVGAGPNLEPAFKALGEIIYDQGAQVGSGEKRVYFRPLPRDPKKLRLKKPRARSTSRQGSRPRSAEKE